MMTADASDALAHGWLPVSTQSIAGHVAMTRQMRVAPIIDGHSSSTCTGRPVATNVASWVTKAESACMS